MSNSLVFRIGASLVYPHMCVGCLAPFNLQELGVNVGKGEPGIGKMILSAAVFGPLPGYFMAKSDEDYFAELIPLCNTCFEQLTADEHNDMQRDIGILSKPTKSCRFFSCDISSGCVNLRVKSHAFANAVRALNSGVVFSSLEECLNAPILQTHPLREEKPPDSNILESSMETITVLPMVEDEKKTQYERDYGRELSPLELAIIDAWHRKGAEHKTIFTYPNISAKKLENAKRAYAKIGEDELVISLQDNTIFGSAKNGLLFTTMAIYWKSNVGEPVGRVSFKDIPPHSVNSTYKTVGTNKIFIGDQIIEVYMITDTKTLQSITSFIAESAMIFKCKLTE